MTLILRGMADEVVIVADLVSNEIEAQTEGNRLGRLTEAWLKVKRSEHTRSNYRRDLRDWLLWCEGQGTPPLKVKMHHVDEWITFQRESGPRNDGRPAAESSIARRVATISSWYTYILRNTASDDQPLITHNPALTDARPELDPDYSPTLGLGRVEMDKLLDQADRDGATTSALIRLIFFNGLRCGSALNARIEDLGHHDGHRVLTVTVKRGKLRRIAIPPVIGNALDGMLAKRGDPAEGPLFLTPSGQPMYESYLWRLIRRLGRRAGIENANQLSPHSLRHSAITEYLNENASLRDVQDFAGHADPRTTRRYDRARGDLDRSGAYVLARRYAGGESA
jgi:integrase/recombinase XerD